MTAKFILTKSHTFEVANDVYFFYDFESAVEELLRLEKETGEQWEMAEIIDRSSWLFKFYSWITAW